MAVKRDKVLRDAEKLVQKGKYEQAIREYEKVLKKFPEDTTIINRVGDLYGRVGQLQRAIELYEEIADHFTRDGFTTKAIAILKKIQRLDPQRLDVFERLAGLYFDQGLMIEAKREYQILADWYVKNGELEKAIEAHEKLVDLDPSNHVSALRLADLLLRRGEITSALKVYERLGQMLLDAGKLDEAERLYRHVLEQDPPEGDFLLPVCNVPRGRPIVGGARIPDLWGRAISGQHGAQNPPCAHPPLARRVEGGPGDGPKDPRVGSRQRRGSEPRRRCDVVFRRGRRGARDAGARSRRFAREGRTQTSPSRAQGSCCRKCRTTRRC